MVTETVQISHSFSRSRDELPRVALELVESLRQLTRSLESLAPELQLIGRNEQENETNEILSDQSDEWDGLEDELKDVTFDEEDYFEPRR